MKTHPAEANGKGIIRDMNTVVESNDLGWEGVCLLGSVIRDTTNLFC